MAKRRDRHYRLNKKPSQPTPQVPEILRALGARFHAERGRMAYARSVQASPTSDMEEFWATMEADGAARRMSSLGTTLELLASGVAS